MYKNFVLNWLAYVKASADGVCFDDPWMTRMQRMAEKANSLRRDVDMGMGAL